MIRELVEEDYPDAEKIVLTMDNLNTHRPAAWSEAFAPAHARRLLDKLEIHHTPKHGSWLNMAETELSVLTRQGLDRRIGTAAELQRELDAWQGDRNQRARKCDWQFAAADARVKLKRLYPSIQPG